MAGLAIGGKWIVDGAVRIASSLGVSQAFIGLSIVAIGTSLPELATSAVEAYKRNTDIGMVIPASFLLYGLLFLGKRHKLEKAEGIVFVLAYVAYIGFLIVRG